MTKTVNIPTDADEAALMVLLGTQWLQQHAPERLKHHEPRGELYGGVLGGGMAASAGPEPFIVKHYIDDERPSIKGNGFDGLEIGTDRQDAQEFVDWINARLTQRPDCPHKTDAPPDAPADPNCSWCNAQNRGDDHG